MVDIFDKIGYNSYILKRKEVKNMAVVKVKSHTRDRVKVKSYKRNCFTKNAVEKFLDVRKKTQVKAPTETGNKIIDNVIIPKIPKVGKIIKGINTVYQRGADIARIKGIYDDDCK